ncbi:MAG: nucleotide exchange factor GrpE [Deltaproteobacteria bacterium]|nr:nucleotide exchange factor GrpE [Deltaproteobacteria bacterium]
MAAKRKVKIRTEKDAAGMKETTPHAVEAGAEEDVHPENDSEKNGGEESTDPLREMELRLESLEQEAKENHDRFLRVSAEFENYKKRAAREMNDFRKFANDNIVRAMLPVVDNLDRAIESSGDDQQTVSSVVEGVNMTLKEILKVFEQFGIKPFESLGEPFDPGFHQAVMQEETEDHPDNTVIKELQKGYMMHDRLLRPAMVVVSKKKETKSKDTMKH